MIYPPDHLLPLRTVRGLSSRTRAMKHEAILQDNTHAGGYTITLNTSNNTLTIRTRHSLFTTHIPKPTADDLKAFLNKN
jgi:hypothetical protein